MVSIKSYFTNDVVLAHHTEPGDPVLLEWMRRLIDDLVGIAPLWIVIFLGLVIIAVPTAIIVIFLLSRPRS